MGVLVLLQNLNDKHGTLFHKITISGPRKISMDNKGKVDAFILDFEKAFDTPPHELHKSKLFSYGIGGKTLEWINAVLQAAKGSS